MPKKSLARKQYEKFSINGGSQSNTRSKSRLIPIDSPEYRASEARRAADSLHMELELKKQLKEVWE